MTSNSIDSLMHESRRFAPSDAFSAASEASSEVYAKAKEDRIEFWADKAREYVHWHKPFTETLDWNNPPFARWFADGRLNVAYNCLDRHVLAGNGDRVAIHWEGEPGDTSTITYAQLTEEVKKAANALETLGIRRGDRVAIY